MWENCKKKKKKKLQKKKNKKLSKIFYFKEIYTFIQDAINWLNWQYMKKILSNCF